MKNNFGMEREVVVNSINEIGVLSRITTALSDARININAICGYEMEQEGHVHLVTDDNEKSIEVLSNAGFTAHEREVMKCEVPASFLHPEMESLMNGIEVENNYWCAAEKKGDQAVLYFSIKDNLHPMRARII